MPRLTIAGPDGRERVFDFDGRLSIGRASTCAVRLDDPEASPEHCVIERTDAGRYKIVDLETRTGTAVNGGKVNVRLLESGDRIHIGKWTILFEASERVTDPADQTDRIFLRPRRRIRPLRRRRITPPPKKGPQVFSLEDLRVVVDSLVEEKGSDALDEIRKLLDQKYEEHKGEPLYEALLEERDTLLRMMEINKLINSEHELRKLLEVIMDTVVELAGAERGFLILREKDALAIKVARNFDREAIRKPEFKISHSIAEEVLRTGKPILSADALNDPGLPSAGSVTDLKLRSLLCLPFRSRDQILGCVYMDNRFETGIFVESDLPMLQGFADQAAIAIENARLFEENERRRQEIERLNAQLKEKVEKQFVELTKATQDVLSARRDVALKHDYSAIVGKSRAMQEVFYLLDKVIDTDEPVFIHGESGTGKELVARAIHLNSKRAKAGRFVSENCSAIPDTLLESELFGHEKGAFTGAIATKPGLFEVAHRGSLFLDEIGDMSPDMQKMVLRAIQEGEIRRVGGKEIIGVDVRFISASNRDLKELIKSGEFREDLYYRLNVVQINLPPLRDRREDIPLLVDAFLDRIAREQESPKKSLDESALWYLQNYSWPGNVRELENEIRRAVALSEEQILPEHWKEEIRARDIVRPAIRIPTGSALKDIVKEAIEDVERRVIVKVLQQTGWKKSEAARLLGISRPTLDAKIEAYTLERGGE